MKEFSNQEDYDQVWCVFDRDSWTEEDFNKAIKNAKAQGFGVAYSNEAFELWYILHFEFLNTGIPRTKYLQKLNSLLGNSLTGQKYCSCALSLFGIIAAHAMQLPLSDRNYVPTSISVSLRRPQ